MRYSNKQAALSYASKGWKVFPVNTGLKKPLAALAPNGHKDATSDEALLRWWTSPQRKHWPQQGALWCADVDSHKELPFDT